MPKLSTARPRYSKHKASGQAFVKIEGQFIYLGLHGSEISKQRYDRIIAEWLTNNLQRRGESCDRSVLSVRAKGNSGQLVSSEICASVCRSCPVREKAIADRFVN